MESAFKGWNLMGISGNTNYCIDIHHQLVKEKKADDVCIYFICTIKPSVHSHLLLYFLSGCGVFNINFDTTLSGTEQLASTACCQATKLTRALLL